MHSQLFLPDTLLHDYDFFTLFPFDGGGYFIQKQLVGSLDDCTITDTILRGALEDFGPLEALDFTAFENWRTIEKSCWINRMYFIVSMARCAMLRRDRSLAHRILAIIAYFNDAFPPPGSREDVQELNREVTYRREHDYNRGAIDGAVPYQWYDFQPASRIVNALNAMNFLRDFKLPQEPFVRFVRNNGTVIACGDDDQHLSHDNHQALRGLALLYAGQFLHDDDFIRRGNTIWNHHMNVGFQADGMQVDMSPSYHVFESWIAREGLRLGTPTAESRRRIDKAFRICRHLQQPDGKSLVINDGYALDMTGFLQTIPPGEDEPVHALALPESGLAVYRSPRLFAVLDSTRCIGEYAHFHAGKNAPTLWLDNTPFLVDSACCSYDNDLFRTWFKLPQAHSSLLVDGRGDATLQGRYRWQDVTPYALTPWHQDSVTCSTDHWSRTLTVRGGTLLLDDRIRLPKNALGDLIFNLHPKVTPRLGDTRILLTCQEVIVTLEWQADAEVTWALAEGKVFLDDQVLPTQRLICSFHGPALSLRTVWHSQACPSRPGQWPAWLLPPAFKHLETGTHPCLPHRHPT